MLAQVSQRRTLVEGASNLQLLFSKAEVQAWQDITSTVATVLDLIERHEVWAELKTDADRTASKLTYEKIDWILQRAIIGLKTSDGQITARNAKKMLINCNAVLALTKIFSCNCQLKDKEANENTRHLASKVNEALQALCKNAPNMQEVSVDAFKNKEHDET